jgi:hypothetical protein
MECHVDKGQPKKSNRLPFPAASRANPIRADFSPDEFERVKLGVLPDDMGHWLIFLEGQRRQYIHFVRAWSGFSVYKLRVEWHRDEYRVTEAWISRDPRQYTSTDEKYDAELLSEVIERVLINPENLT